jgi:hypothetical protein
MGWRFRKSFGFGSPHLRFLLTRRGLGLSSGWRLGIPGIRFGVSPTGDLFVTVGFRRTGLSWTKRLRRNRPAPNDVDE